MFFNNLGDLPLNEIWITRVRVNLGHVLKFGDDHALDNAEHLLEQILVNLRKCALITSVIWIKVQVIDQGQLKLLIRVCIILQEELACAHSK